MPPDIILQNLSFAPDDRQLNAGRQVQIGRAPVVARGILDVADDRGRHHRQELPAMGDRLATGATTAVGAAGGAGRLRNRRETWPKRRGRADSGQHDEEDADVSDRPHREDLLGVCTENLIRVDDVMESPKLAE
jgi:hypothetical protein